MKQLFFLLLLISAYNVKAQQLPLTIGEAYAYEVGDTFQYRFSYYQINDGQGYSGNNVIVITGKTIVGDSTYIY
jgi:hypothetical protein